MEEGVLIFLRNSLNVIGKLTIFLIFFQIGIKQIWDKYPYSGFKKSFFLFLVLLGVYGFIRGLITGW